MIVPAVHHTDSQSGWSFRFATLLAHASRVTEHRSPLSSPDRLALDRLDTAQPEALLLIGVATAETLSEIGRIDHDIVLRI